MPDPIINFYNMDCMEFMKDCPDKKYDLAIVDPPYGISASKKNKYHGDAMTKYIPKEWDYRAPGQSYFKGLFKISKNQIIWGGNYFPQYLTPQKNWIVWDKLQPEGVSFSMHELAFCSVPGQAMIFKKIHDGNRISNSPDKAKKYLKIHPTQKPIDLYRWLLKNYAKEGDKILDTHGGSMSSAIACHQMGFDLDIIELDKDYFDAAKQRFDKEISQMRLF